VVGQLSVSEQWNEMPSVSGLQQQPSAATGDNHVPVEAWSFTDDNVADDDVATVVDSCADTCTSASEGNYIKAFKNYVLPFAAGVKNRDGERIYIFFLFFTREGVVARISYRNSVCPSACHDPLPV